MNREVKRDDSGQVDVLEYTRRPVLTQGRHWETQKGRSQGEEQG